MQNEYANLYRGALNSFVATFGGRMSPWLIDELYATSSVSAHNQFINIMLYYGVAAFLLLILFYYYILRGLRHVARTTKDPIIRAVSLGLIGSFVAYMINSLFHNNGPFFSEPQAWFFIGIAAFVFNEHTRSFFEEISGCQSH